MTPKTPPESPAIFHYSLPSPGLVSPLALFESLNGNRDAAPDGWVEQVDFRLSAERARTMNTKPKPSALPSLDQISARMMSRTARQSDYDPDSMTPVYTARPRPSFGVGRLKMPLRTAPVPIVSTQPQHALPPQSPLLNPSNELSVTTLVVPRSNSSSPTKLTETNLNALNSRGQRASNMLTALRKRTLSQDKITTPTMEANSEFKTRRRSAPADLMPCRARVGFEHPVLALPGAF
ncbi:hypothetical protein NLJ89_g10077 [Agrocybe chaxingu]|uniref:Uncharacterized protein n=1 Tax=Agrocybe chaxingu TaxID=84603 RepID=A0A9W8JRV1_9AGAR|nr:hypothetical protein NLJ89_g10077 [Agrocybe chaxingu]